MGRSCATARPPPRPRLRARSRARSRGAWRRLRSRPCPWRGPRGWPRPPRWRPEPRPRDGSATTLLPARGRRPRPRRRWPGPRARGGRRPRPRRRWPGRPARAARRRGPSRWHSSRARRSRRGHPAHSRPRCPRAPARCARAGSWLEPVTDAPHREQVDGLGWVSLDLLAQSPHVHRDRRAVPVPREVPDVLEELRSRERYTGVRREVVEEVELLAGERDRLALYPRPTPARVALQP